MSEDHNLSSLQKSDAIFLQDPNSPSNGTTLDYTFESMCEVWPINLRYSLSSFHSVTPHFNCHHMGEAIILLSS